MAEIKVLDQDTINQIAAGEVVERPASIVKELVENAVDASSTAVTVEIKGGGIDFIRITDNGCGIEKEQVRKAFLPHATSKIRSADDLETVASLGFRGEALSSIAAVAKVELVTKTDEGISGIRYVIEGGEEKSCDEIGCPEGTTFIIRDLFFNTPARRKFLKSKMTEAGYVGEDVENILLKLIQAADYDIERAEYGIIYLDEIDKITRKSENPSITRDVSGEGVQQALLKIVEGTVANVPPQGGRKHPHQELIQIDTTNILFICGGAFEGIDKIIEKRIDQKSIGFNAEIAEKHEDDVDKLLAQVLPQDLVKFGLIPELVGRVPVTVSLEMLDHDALIRILTEPKNAIVKQYQKLLELDGVKLVFDDSALNEIADISLKRKTGARGLRAIMENTMMDIMYRAPSDETLKTCRITGDVVTGKAKPECEHTSVNTQSA